MPANPNPRRRTSILTLHAGLASATLALAAAPTPAVSAEVSTEPSAAASQTNPLELIYRNQQAQASGERVDRRQTYEAVLARYEPDTFWGQWAVLSLTRWHLAGTGTADAQAARETLAMLPDEPAHDALADQRHLWQRLVAIHEAVDRTLADPSHEPAFGGWGEQQLPPVPERLEADVRWAVELIARRFEEAGQPQRGAACFGALLQRLNQPTLQAACLKNLAELRLGCGDRTGAAAAARAYWLTSVAQPGRLPSAIDVVAAVMEADGAEPEAIGAFRRQQVRGGAEGIEASPLRPASAPAEGRALFPDARIQAAKTPLRQARLRLLNGNLHAATQILQDILSDADGTSPVRNEALMLVRMALALHDGHMHRIGRYERYLAQSAAGRADASPLKALIDSVTDRRTSATDSP